MLPASTLTVTVPLLTAQSSTPPIAVKIAGAKGSGKTVLARQLAHRPHAPRTFAGGGPSAITSSSTSSSFLTLTLPFNGSLHASLLAVTISRRTTSVADSPVACASFPRYTSPRFPNTSTGSVSRVASDSPHDIEMPHEKLMLELALEAARRANWDALHGPEHLRSAATFSRVNASKRSDKTRTIRRYRG